MARQFSKVSSSIWDSRKFRKLGDDDARLAYLYLITGPQANSAGCYSLSIGYACDKLDWERDRFRKAIERLCQAYLIEFDEDENAVRIVNWWRFNAPTNPKHARGVLVDIEQASSFPLKCSAFHELVDNLREKAFKADKDLVKDIERLSKAYPKTLGTQTETQTQTETRQRPDGDEDRDGEGVSARANGGGVLPSAAAPDGAALGLLTDEEDNVHPLLKTRMMRGTA